MDPTTLIVSAALTIVNGLFALIGLVVKLRYDAKVAAQAQQIAAQNIQIASLQIQNTGQATQISTLTQQMGELQQSKDQVEKRLADERSHCDSRLSVMETEIQELRSRENTRTVAEEKAK